ncbi:MAG TPA: carboxypeptidase regulatory-like domain-containing protein, partial [Fibrella sp.]
MIRFMRLLAIVLVCLSPLLSFAQENPGRQFWLRGTVVDEQKEPAPFVTVTLYRTSDSVLVTGVVSDESGKFEVQTKPGLYHLKLSSVSSQNRVIPNLNVVDKDLQLGPQTLKGSARQLEEVVVAGEKSQMELSLDKKVFNVGKDLANAGGTASDILKNVPSVAVDGEGNVSLRGSNSVRILIDGKPSGLVSLKGGSGLQQLQGSMVERVEVITNP